MERRGRMDGRMGGIRGSLDDRLGKIRCVELDSICDSIVDVRDCVFALLDFLGPDGLVDFHKCCGAECIVVAQE